MSFELHHGDCLDVMTTLPDASIDCVLTDPPYGTTACKWDSVIPFDPMWKELKRIAKPKAAICLFGSQPFTSALVMSNIRDFRYEWVWDKKRATGGTSAACRPMKAHENVLIFGDGQYMPQMSEWSESALKRMSVKDYAVTTNEMRFKPHIVRGKAFRADRGKSPTSVLRIPALGATDSERSGHPTQKPVELLRYLIRTYTLEGQTVLDFTMGSGSTGVACELEGRNFIGIEKDANYFEIAKNRIEGVRKKEPLFAEAA